MADADLDDFFAKKDKSRKKKPKVLTGDLGGDNATKLVDEPKKKTKKKKDKEKKSGAQADSGAEPKDQVVSFMSGRQLKAVKTIAPFYLRVASCCRHLLRGLFVWFQWKDTGKVCILQTVMSDVPCDHTAL